MTKGERSAAIQVLLERYHGAYYCSLFEPARFISNTRLPFEDEDDDEKFAAQMAAGKAFHEQLDQMPDQELAARKAAIDREKHEASERAHWSNHPLVIATNKTFDHWCKAAYWNTAEAAALLIARDPTKLDQNASRNETKGSDTLRAFLALHELISRAVTAKQIDFSKGPGGYIAWAKRNRIDVPAALEDAVRNHGHQVDDWKGICDRQAVEIGELKAKLAAQEGAGEKSGSAKDTGRIGTRERESLLKLVLAMAIKGYVYDPKAGRNSAIREIAGDLQQLGIPLDEDTVRKYLNEARDLLPPAN
jgi:hypothetical protein